jgi:hypothetical protein
LDGKNVANLPRERSLRGDGENYRWKGRMVTGSNSVTLTDKIATAEDDKKTFFYLTSVKAHVSLIHIL